MRRRTVTVLAVFAAAATAAPAQVVVQRGPGGGQRMTLGGASGPFLETPASFGVNAWRVGQWARYSIAQTAGQMPITQIRTVSIVGQRGELFWVETQDDLAGMMSQKGPVRKMLIPFGVVRERVGTEVYTLGPDSSVRREVLVRAAAARDAADFTFPQGWERVGEEAVQVTAGTLRAMHWRKGNENLWTSAEAGPLGIVKYESDTVTIELGSKGTDARSRIPFGG